MRQQRHINGPVVPMLFMLIGKVWSAKSKNLDKPLIAQFDLAATGVAVLPEPEAKMQLTLSLFGRMSSSL